MGYRHFNLMERTCISLLLPYADITQSEIAVVVGRDTSSISREISRNGGRGCYNAILAENRYISKRILCSNTTKASNRELSDFIVAKIKLHWSPEQISGFLEKSNNSFKISFSSIYRYVYAGLLDNISRSSLRHKGKMRVRPESKHKMKDTKRISERPAIVEKRKRKGDFEIDTILSGRSGGSKACLLSAVDRTSGYLISMKLPDKKSKSVLDAVKIIVRTKGSKIFKTITSDNGLEFALHKEIEKITKSSFYFADPYCSWQRGTNENTNGLIREFFPKGFDFSTIEQRDIEEVVELINNRPRKRLEYKTPKEVFC